MRWFFRGGLRVLMYHKVSPHTTPVADPLTVWTVQLSLQLSWLREQGFNFITCSELLDGGKLPAWPVLVTFDDAYADTFEHARPILRALGVSATVFVPTDYIGQASSWDVHSRPLMNADQLRALAAEGWEIGLHSHRHENFAALSPTEAADDVRKNFAALAALGLKAVPALAYPYGGRPREAAALAAMKRAIASTGVRLAFRIGNRINGLPLSDPFDVQRLGIEGDKTFGAFQRKIAWGRLVG